MVNLYNASQDALLAAQAARAVDSAAEQVVTQESAQRVDDIAISSNDSIEIARTQKNVEMPVLPEGSQLERNALLIYRLRKNVGVCLKQRLEAGTLLLQAWELKVVRHEKYGRSEDIATKDLS